MRRRSKTWVAPPNWPAAPEGWQPPPGWQPDPAWGPPPADWQFWQVPGQALAKGPETSQEADTGTSMPAEAPSVQWDDTEVRWGRKLASKADGLAAVLQPKLAEGEKLLGVFTARQAVPPVDLLIFTNFRVVQGLAANLAKKAGFVSAIPAAQVAAVRFNWNDTVQVDTLDGAKHKMGTTHRDDRPAIEQLVGNVRANAPSDDVTKQLEKADARIGFTAPNQGEIHLGEKVDADLARRVQESTTLVEGEVVLALFAAPAATESQAQLLAFTNIRAAGLREGSRRTTEDITGMWSLQPAEAEGFSVSSTAKVTVTLTGGEQVSVGSFRIKDRAALDHFGAALLAIDAPESAVAAAADDGLPLPFKGRVFGGPSAVVLRDHEDGGTGQGQFVAGQVVAFSAETVTALAEGFPEKDARLVDAILQELTFAEQACESGDIVGEEAHLANAVRIAGTAGLTRRGKARGWVEKNVATKIATRRLRRDVEAIGAIGRSLHVFNDRILHGDRCFVLDEDVAASVEVDGHVLESSRPTLTRMAIGSSFLPGGALAIGMALPKKTREDTRTANFIIVHPRWQIIEPIDPDGAGSTRGVAAQINATASSLRRRSDLVARGVTAAQPQDGLQSDSASADRMMATPEVPGTSSVTDQLDQLERIAAMEAAGTLSAEQADTMRSRVLSG